MSEESPKDDKNSNDGINLDDYVPKSKVEELVKERIAKAKKASAEKYGDYDNLKAKAAKLDEIEAGNQTELEKLIKRAEKAEAERDDFKTKIDNWKARKDTESSARKLFNEAQLPDRAWKYYQKEFETGADEDALRAALDTIKLDFPAKSIGDGGRPQEGKPPEPTTLQQKANEALQRGDPDTYIALMNTISSGDIK